MSQLKYFYYYFGNYIFKYLNSEDVFQFLCNRCKDIITTLDNVIENEPFKKASVFSQIFDFWLTFTSILIRPLAFQFSFKDFRRFGYASPLADKRWWQEWDNCVRIPFLQKKYGKNRQELDNLCRTFIPEPTLQAICVNIADTILGGVYDQLKRLEPRPEVRLSPWFFFSLLHTAFFCNRHW